MCIIGGPVVVLLVQQKLPRIVERSIDHVERAARLGTGDRDHLPENGCDLIGGSFLRVVLRGNDVHSRPPRPAGLKAGRSIRNIQRAIAFRRIPIPSTSSSMTSPACSHRPCSMPEPPVTVPDPHTSPGWMVSLLETYAIRSSKENWRPPLELSVHSSPFTRAIMRRLFTSSSSGVTRYGPSALLVSKSLPLLGPMPSTPSRFCWSRALKSFQIV